MFLITYFLNVLDHIFFFKFVYCLKTPKILDDGSYDVLIIHTKSGNKIAICTFCLWNKNKSRHICNTTKLCIYFVCIFIDVSSKIHLKIRLPWRNFICFVLSFLSFKNSKLTCFSRKILFFLCKTIFKVFNVQNMFKKIMKNLISRSFFFNFTYILECVFLF